MSGTRLRSIAVALLLAVAMLGSLSSAAGAQSPRSTAATLAADATAPAAPSARLRPRCLPRNHPSRRPPRLHQHRHCARTKPPTAPVPAPTPTPAPGLVPPNPVTIPTRPSDPTPPTEPTPGADGWALVAADEFSAARLDTSRWTPFSGVPACCADARWDPAQVEVSAGTLKLHTSPSGGAWLSGGVGGWNWDRGARTYGRYDARLRLDAGSGVSAAALLWPSDDSGSSEIDFYRISETWGDRSRMMMTTHWGTPSDHHLSQQLNDGDFTRWHTVSVRWSAEEISYLLDEQVVKVETDPARIPDTMMWVGLQTHAHRIDGAWPILPAGRSSIAMEVDWVRVYQRG